MPGIRPHLRAALLLSLAAIMPAWADDGVSDRWHTQVGDVSAHADTTARGDAISRRLDALGIAWKREAFEQDGQSGHNLVADLGGPDGAPLLLIGAHYDQVDVGHGATDNASGVAAVLELAQALKAKPLAGHRVQVAFWDLEEKGLLGSRAWVATPGREKPALYVNFDVFGWGDTLWMMAPDAGTPLVAALRAASQHEKLGFQPGDKYPPTDHLAFLKAGWPAVSFSLVGGDEIDPILAVFGGAKPDRMPKVMQVIHSPRDTTAELDRARVDDALRVVEAGLRAWDAAPAP
jgi:aminopeptidase S